MNERQWQVVAIMAIVGFILNLFLLLKTSDCFPAILSGFIVFWSIAIITTLILAGLESKKKKTY